MRKFQKFLSGPIYITSNLDIVFNILHTIFSYLLLSWSYWMYSMHKKELRKGNPNDVEKRHEKEFPQWFKRYVST